ncbi:MAG: tripartite tricarboxylate transporter substrate-binding protein [Pseudolabrys sp.]|nr:tripartite tricarboxylate transporter substrate-binding protein [Pseudolabrys sp.]
MIRKLLSVAAVGLSALALTGETRAQNYPTRAITIIVPFAAGGPTDIIARVIAAQMSTSLGQQVVIENVAGAAGTTGMLRAARATPDGYTLLVGGMSTMSFSPTLYPNLPVSSMTGLDPVGIVASAPIVLVVGKDVPAKTVKEFADYVKANSDKVVNGHAGVGSSSHLACSLLNSRMGAKPQVVPYRGTGPAMNDLVGGQIQYMCDQTTSVMGQVQGGGAKALAVLASTRSAALPNVPTIAEAGFPGTEMEIWNAVFAPKGTPPEIIKTLNAAVVKGIQDPTARARFADLGAEAPGADRQSPEALAKILAADVDKWGKVINEAGIKPIN